MVGHVPSPTPIGPTSGRFDHRDLQPRAGSRAMVGGDDARGQPAGRPAADDHYVLDPIAHGHGPVVIAPAIVTKEPLVGATSGSPASTYAGRREGEDACSARYWPPNLYRAPIM